jgi:hypothetical protein
VGLSLALLLLTGPAVAQHKPETGKGEGPAAPTGPVFVRLAPITLPVIEGSKVTRQVGLVLVLEMAEGHTVADVETKQTLLINAFIGDLYEVYQLHSATPRVVELTTIRPRLQAIADAVLGRGVVKRILVTHLFEQPR